MNQKLQKTLDFFEEIFFDTCPPYLVGSYKDNDTGYEYYKDVHSLDRDEYITLHQFIRALSDKELKKIENSLDGCLELEDREAPSKTSNKEQENRTDDLTKMKDHLSKLKDRVINLDPVNQCEQVNKETLLDILNLVRRCIIPFREVLE